MVTTINNKTDLVAVFAHDYKKLREDNQIVRYAGTEYFLTFEGDKEDFQIVTINGIDLSDTNAFTDLFMREMDGALSAILNEEMGEQGDYAEWIMSARG